MSRLLAPRGCPWDRAQTHESLIPYLREESRELERALAGGSWHEIEDELGDLLFHVFFHAKLGDRDGHFDLDTIAESQARKLIRRHPHVFGRTRRFKDADEVFAHWGEIKRIERALRAKEVAARERRRAGQAGSSRARRRWMTTPHTAMDSPRVFLGESIAGKP